MAGIWCLYGHWGKNGYRHVPDTDLVYLYFIPYHGISADRLFYPGFLDEYQKIHFIRPEESAEISLKRPMISAFFFRNLPEINAVPCSSSITPILTMGS